MIEQYYTKLHLSFIIFDILQLHDFFGRYDLALITQHQIKGYVSGKITLSLSYFYNYSISNRRPHFIILGNIFELEYFGCLGKLDTL